jgi:SAM-dependent methyltransferase
MAVSGDANPSQAWLRLAPDYERARTREDSLDRLVEWPAQRDLLGDVTGRSVLDVGCGNGGKLAELVADGATASVGVDVTGNFIAPTPGLKLLQGDLNELDSMSGLVGRTFDRILFLQSFGYAKDPVATLQAARAMLTDDGHRQCVRPLRRDRRLAGSDVASSRVGALDGGAFCKLLFEIIRECCEPLGNLAGRTHPLSHEHILPDAARRTRPIAAPMHGELAALTPPLARTGGSLLRGVARAASVRTSDPW